jgi:hypothetical protein
MGFLTSLLEWFVAFVAGFLGHVVAHDFCEVTPMISEKVIEAAASQLPVSIRDRYLDEWRADLWDQPGTIAKLKWAFGCFWSARRLRLQDACATRNRMSVGFTFENGETVRLDIATLKWMGSTLKLITLCAWLPMPLRIKLLQGVTLVSAVETTKRYGAVPDQQRLRQLLLALSRGSNHVQVGLYIDGIAAKEVLGDLWSDDPMGPSQKALDLISELKKGRKQ